MTSNTWRSGCAISSTGQYMAVAMAGGIYISSNYGSSWTRTFTTYWCSDIEMSSDGKIMIALADLGRVDGIGGSNTSQYAFTFYTSGTTDHQPIYRSDDYGATWSEVGKDYYENRVILTQENHRTEKVPQNKIAMSSDGGTILITSPQVGFYRYSSDTSLELVGRYSILHHRSDKVNDLGNYDAQNIIYQNWGDAHSLFAAKDEIDYIVFPVIPGVLYTHRLKTHGSGANAVSWYELNLRNSETGAYLDSVVADARETFFTILAYKIRT